MGFLRNWFGLDLEVPTVDPDQVETFAVDEVAIPSSVVGLESYLGSTAAAPRIDRRAAVQVPAVKRSRDLIAGVLGGLPIDVFDQSRRQVRSSLLEQPERSVPRSVTMARTFEDMLFEGVAWWHITEYLGEWPAYVKRLKPRQVTVDEGRGRVLVDGEVTPDRELIRFDSPTEGLLIAGARAIRTCLALDNYAANAAQGIPPLDWFSPAEDGVDPFASTLEDDVAAAAEEEAAIAEFLNDWQDARRSRTTAYVPAALKYNAAGFDPKVLQLAEQRQHAVLEIARVAGIDPEELGVSTTSRTYANMFDRRKAYTDFTLGLYRQAFEDRVSMGDVTPRGQYAKFNLDAFLRSDPLSRYQAIEVGLRVGAIGKDEVRPLEDKPPLDPDQVAAAPPAPPQLRAVPPRQETAS